MSNKIIDNIDTIEGVAAYLKQHEEKDLLRLLTCGSVDDGKSTLIGRLLYDSHMIYEDQLAAVMKDSKVHCPTGDDFDPALLTDGLKAEREQGITIDVAYRYFSTDKRKFIIADCPGHEQYTRNMATGASNCSLAVILIDARYGVITQTCRHSFICSLLGIKHAAVAVNKMDLVGWDEQVFNKIVRDYKEMAARLGFTDIHFIPVSALKGDNVVNPSENMPWYDDVTLLHHLEHVNVTATENLIDMRYPVQYVIRPDLNFRGYAGTVASGVLRKGAQVMALPSRKTSRIASISGPGGALDEAPAGLAAVVTLEDEIDVSRGDMLAPVDNLPHVEHEFEAMLVWMHDTPAELGASYQLKHSTRTLPAVLTDIRYRVDVNTMRKIKPDDPAESANAAKVKELQLNDIARCHVTLHRPIAFDPYQRNRHTGAFILVDRITHATVAAGMILDRIVADSKREPVSRNISHSRSLVKPAQRQALLGQKPCTVWLTGLSGSGKSTIAREMEKHLIEQGRLCMVLDGDNIRHGLNRDLGFSAEDRSENIRRIAEVARLFNEAGVIVITAFISPYRKDRQSAREIIAGTAEAAGAGEFVEVWLKTALEVCQKRDPKGLYAKAGSGAIVAFTGVTDPYEEPMHAELAIDTAEKSVEDSVAVILDDLAKRIVIK